MYSWAQKRKFIYGAVFFVFIFFAVFISLRYFFYQKPTCSDNLKDGDETGVDCGGSCPLLCQNQSIDPVVLWARTFKVSGNVYNATAYVQNANLDAGIADAPYIFRIYSGDELVYEKRGSTFISPGKTFAVFEPGIVIKDKAPTRTTFEFTGPFSWTKFSWSEPKLDITNKVISGTDSSPKLTASVENKTIKNLSDIEFVSIIYDSNGNAVASSRTFADYLSAESSAGLVFTWPLAFETGTESCKSPVDVLLAIDRSGSMSGDGKNPPQPLTDVKDAAASFVSELADGDQAGLVSFADSASNPIDMKLTSDTAELLQKIDAVSIHSGKIQNTNIADGLLKSSEELSSVRHNGKSGKYIVLLTDGVPTEPQKAGDKNYPEEYASSTAAQIKSGGVKIYSIGLGSKVNPEFLKMISTAPEYYYSATSSKDLVGVYSKISAAICKKGPAVIEIIPRVNPFGKLN